LLICAHGYARVSLDRIAACAGVSRSNLLFHFGSKDQLWMEAASSLVRGLRERHCFGGSMAGRGTAAQRVGNWLENLVSILDVDPLAEGVVLSWIFSVTVPECLREQTRDLWSERIESLATELAATGHMLSGGQARFLTAALQGGCLHWYAESREQSLRDYLAPTLQWLQCLMPG
jgi:AcrR family transcriptional regulator